MSSKEFKETKIRKLISDFDNTSIKKRGNPTNPVKRRRKLESIPAGGGVEIYKAFFSPARIMMDGRFMDDIMISSFNSGTREVVVLCEVFRGEIIFCRNMKSGWYYYSVYERNYAYSKNAGRINLALIQR